MATKSTDRTVKTQPSASRAAERRSPARWWVILGAAVLVVATIALTSLMNRPPARAAPGPADTTAPEVPNHGAEPAPAATAER